jgi:hypothetical protein
MKIDFFVLTGGPCAGKSTALNWLKEAFGDRIVFVPEVATWLFESCLYSAPNPWSYEWQVGLQRLVLRYQLKFEAEAAKEARRKNIRIIVTDRGILDGAGYMRHGVEEFFRRFNYRAFGLSERAVLERYCGVFHLRSRAIVSPKLFLELQGNNPHRFEGDISRSVEICRRIEKAWEGYSNRLILTGCQEENQGAVAEVLAKLV